MNDSSSFSLSSPDEAQRGREVRRFQIMDSAPEAAFERLTRLAARLFEVPIAIIVLIDEERQWLKSSYGLDFLPPGSAESPGGAESPGSAESPGNAESPGGAAMFSDQVMVVPDAALDARFAENPLVTGETAIRFYAAAPLHALDGVNVGTFAIMDTAPREMSDSEIAALVDLAALAVEKMEQRLLPGGLSETGSERREADRSAQSSEEHFRALIEHSVDAIGILDERGVMRYNSPSIESLLGYAPSELNGKNAFDLMHPDDAERAGAALTRALQTPGGNFTLEYRFRHRDGSWRVLESVGKTLPGDTLQGALGGTLGNGTLGNGLGPGVLLSSRDITARKQAESDRAQLAAIVASSEDAIVATSPEGIIAHWNAAAQRIYGYAPSEVLGRSMRMLVPPGQGDEIAAILARVGRGELIQHMETRRVRRDGTEIDVSLSVSPIRDVSGRVVGVSSIARDISRHKAGEIALKKAHDELESRIAERTLELACGVQVLQTQIAERERAEAELNRFFTVSIDMLCIAGFDGFFKRLNPVWETTLGWSLAELIGAPFLDFVHPDDRDTTAQRHADLAAGLDVASFENRYRCQDGSYKWLRWQVTAVLNEQLQYAVAHDISEQKQREIALHESESRFRQLVAQAADAFFIIDGNAQLLDVNQRACESLGYSRAELIGLGVADIDAFADPALFQAAWQKGLRGEALTLDAVHRRKDGSTFPVELRVGLFEVGGARSMLVLARDVTERKVAERSLLESEARKSAILETALDCVISADFRGQVLDWNPAAERTFGFSRAEALGRAVTDLIVPAPLCARFEAALKRYQTTREGPQLGQRLETLARRKDGSEIAVELSITPITAENPPSFTAYLRDITARRASEAALQAAKADAERANRAKSEFLSRMSHELRTPLNAILGFGQILELGDLSARQRQGVEQILKGGRHLLELINEILDLSRIEAEQQEVEVEPVPVAEILADALELVRPLADSRGITLSGDFPSGAPVFVWAERRRLSQVLLNLLANAVKYNCEGGSVSVWVGELIAGQARTTVSDTGPGLSPEQIAQLFRPFERLGAEQSNVEGTGLGLALSKRLIEAMGGVISAQSTPGQGSRFSVDLPIAPSPAPAMGVRPAGEVELAPRAAIRGGETQALVLYIEDNLANFSLVQNILRHRLEIKLLAAMQGEVGVELAQKHRPDLILLDFHLPDISGDEVLARLRQNPETRTIPVIVVSADATTLQIERMRAAGAVKYLTKPLDVRQFLDTLDANLKTT